ncbi:MAG: tetratricopeptide repeat protein [Planctomycetes bacterium]|nr:tetratricopeptide repeat protein [Planctomycetota bacterium]
MIARSLVSALLLATVVPLFPSIALAQSGLDALPEEVRRIRQAYIALDVDTALALSNDWLISHPTDPTALELRARSLRQLGRLEDAVKTAEQIQPRDMRIKLLIAELMSARPESLAQAQAIVDEVQADQPNAFEPHLVRARLLLTAQRIKEATSELSYVLTVKPDCYEAVLLSGILAEMTSKNEEAMQLYLMLVGKSDKKWLRTDVHHERDAVLGLAGVYIKLQRYEDAIALYQQLLQKLPKSPMLWAQIGMAQSMLERTADAISSYEKAVELSPGMGEFLGRLADLLRGAGRLEEAVARYERILEVVPSGPGHVFADVRLAEIRLEQSQLDAAKKHADAAMTVAPENPDALMASARVREKLGDTAAAKENYRKALSKDPLLFDATYRLALLLARSQNAAEQAEGKRLLERHKKVEPLLQDLTRTRKELDLAPRSAPLLTRMAGLLNLAGDYEMARRLGEQADRIKPGSPSTCIQLGYIAANTGDKAAALKYFERAQQVLKDNKVKELDEYIEKLRKGEELPLPMGQYFRPAQQDTPAAGAGAGAAAPAKSGAGGN